VRRAVQNAKARHGVRMELDFLSLLDLATMTTMNPWDVPPHPSSGDSPIEKLYQSMGRALSHWEKLEARLMFLYAAFLNKPEREHSTYESYEKAPKIKDRINLVERSAELFFIKHMDQNMEGRIASILLDIRRFTDRRNDIAQFGSRNS
jgi:hypothetical protein